MRTSVFLGLTAIADAIRIDWFRDDVTIAFLSCALLSFIIMDIAEFFTGLKNKV